MLYVIGRTLSILFLLAINISINLFWFKVSVILGIAILLAISFVVYKTIALSLEEKKKQKAISLDILNHLN
jgi:positive regulator of sigma E activity